MGLRGADRALQAAGFLLGCIWLAGAALIVLVLLGVVKF